MKYHWYVTYTYQNRTGNGRGCLVIDTVEDWFPLKIARDWIKNHIKSDVVILDNWTLMSDLQVEEYKEE